MTSFAAGVLLAWPFVILLIFSVTSAPRATAISYAAGWMLLPYMQGWKVAGIPEYSRLTATNMGVMVSLAIFHMRSYSTLKLSVCDVVMMLWCLCPIASSVSNGLGVYDGLSNAMEQAINWGMPYVVGRAVFRTQRDIRELALVIFVSALCYIPLILYENRMSAQLQEMLYGRNEWDTAFARGGRYYEQFAFLGYQPRVFFAHGLALTLYMGGAAICGYWLWQSRSVKHVFGLPMSWCVPTVLIAMVLCKALGPSLLTLAGLGALYLGHRFGVRWAMIALLASVPAYIAVRSTGEWTGRVAVEAAKMVSAVRAQSLETRLINEDRLVAKALQQPAFGWGTWGRHRVLNTTGQDITLTDGYWIIIMGQKGLVGLVLWLAVMLIPLLALYRHTPLSAWCKPENAGPLALGTMVLVFFVDCIFNPSLHPVFAVILGALMNLQTVRAPVVAMRPVPRRARPLLAP